MREEHFAAVNWTEAALRQADFCRRKHGTDPMQDAANVAREEGSRRVFIRHVMEACRQQQCAQREQEALAKAGGDER